MAREVSRGRKNWPLCIPASLSLSLASFSGIYTSLPALIEIQGLEWEEREGERERERERGVDYD